MKQAPKYSNRQKPATITLSDFMRIQHEIIPSRSEEENRKERDMKLKTQSQFKISKWDNSSKTQYPSEKERFIADELRRRQIDELEAQYQAHEKDKIIRKGKQNLFEAKDDIKAFNATLLHSDVLKEREFQQEISKKKKEIEKAIDKKYDKVLKKQLEDYDLKEQIKWEEEQEKKADQMAIINEQLQESKIKNIKDYQEKAVEGILIKESIKRGLEEDKKKEEEIEQKKKEQRDQFVKANEDLEKHKKAKIQKEKEADRKIEEFAIKKQQMEDMRKRVEKEKFDEKQRQKQKIIEDQSERLSEIKEREEQILNKQIKEAEQKKEMEEEIKQKRIKELKSQMEENRRSKREKNQKQKEKMLREEKEFIDSWKERMKQLDQDEKDEKKEKRQKNKELADYQRLQEKERKNKAIKEFEASTKNAYQTKAMANEEQDDYLEYVEGWIKEYHKQGKDIRPMLLELKRYKKRKNLE